LVLQVVYTQNIILAIVAEAYEEAKAKLGTADTSFLLLVLMRILFTTLFVIYRLRMFFGDVMQRCFACTGWRSSHSSLHRPASLTKPGSAPGANGSTTAPGSGTGQGPDGHGGSSFAGRDASGSSLGAFGQPDAVPLMDQQSVGSGLQPTMSRAILPPDVEVGLSETHPSRLRLLSRSFAVSHQYAGSSSALGPGSGRYADHAADLGLPGDGSKTLSEASRGSGTSRLQEPKGFWHRLSVTWHDVILGERHVLRMYSDVYLAPGQVRKYIDSSMHGCVYIWCAYCVRGCHAL
jgi:hypothetical protein